MAGSISFARGAPSLDIVDVEGLRAAAEQAFTDDPGGMTAYGTAVGYVPLREWIAEHHGVGPEQVLVTNGSMQADAFLFDALVAEGDTVIVELPTYDRTLLSLRNRGADVRMVELEPDGIDTAALERVARSPGPSPSSPTSSPTSRTPPATRSRRPSALRLVELARTHGFTIFEDDPYVTLRFEGESLPTMFSTAGRHGRLRVVVLKDGLSRDPRRLPRRARRPHRADRQDRHQHLHLAQHGGPGHRQPVLPLGRRSTAPSPPCATRCASVPTRCATSSLRSSPTPASSRREGGYFLWVDLPDGTDVAALFDAAAARGVQFVKGTDFVLEGGESSLRLAYSGVTPAEIREGVKRLAEAYAEVGREVNAA